MGLGTIGPAEIAEYSGLELLRRMLEGHYPAPPMAGLMNFGLVEVEEGRAVFRGVPGAQHLNPLGSVHGGWAATIMDSALGCCVQTMLAKGEAYTTAEFKFEPHPPDLAADGRSGLRGAHRAQGPHAGGLGSLPQGWQRQAARLSARKPARSLRWSG